KMLALTSYVSGHQFFPDAYYQFNRTGRMDWDVSADLLSVSGRVGMLRNVGVVCTVSQKRPDLGRLACSYPVEFDVDAAGHVQVLCPLPQIVFATSGLALSAVLNTAPGASVTFDFGDGTAITDLAALPHMYARPGRYSVLTRIAADGRLAEYRAAV